MPRARTTPNEHRQITAADIGTTIINRSRTIDGREVIDAYVIVTIEPVDDTYRRDHPDAGPRLKCGTRHIRRNGQPSEVITPWWAPTIGNDKTVEIAP